MKSEISTSIFCFSISSEILSTCLYFLKLISSSYSLPSIYLAVSDALKAARFSSSERNPPIPAKILKDFISTNHLLPDFSNKKQSSFFSKLDRHIDIFISSSSVGSLSSLTIWKSSTPGITPSVLPLSKTQCTVPISSICSIFFVV